MTICVYIHTSICIYTYIYAYMYICIYTYICTGICTYMFGYICLGVGACEEIEKATVVNLVWGVGVHGSGFRV